MPTPNDLFVSIPIDGDTARISVDCEQRADQPINRLLFGKFTEHLGRNIYNGMWAQILQNSSFADWSFFRQLWSWGKGHHRPDVPIEEILAAYDRGLACWWLPSGSAAATYAIDWTDPLNSTTSQRVTVPATAPESGVAQPIYLPVHRTRSYTASFGARGKVEALRISLVRTGTWKVIGETVVEGITADWQTFETRLTLPDGGLAPGELAEFRIELIGGGQVWLDQVFLFPDDQISGFDPDIIRLLKESRLPLLRYPGGNFVSGYRWQDGVGPVDDRPVRANPAWAVVEPNHVGTDEFMSFCAAVGCEPMICVNAGNGPPREAAQWVEYCNGGPDTRFGSQRAEHGHPEPYGVRYWEIGNEIYGGWQIGHCTPEEYAERYAAFRDAMLAVDPDLLLIANGQTLEWNKPLVERKGDQVRSLSLHSLIGGGAKEEKDPEAVFRALMAYTTTYDRELQALAQQAAPTVDDPRIAITELQVFTNVPHLPNNATQTESLFLAGIIHSSLRQGDLIEMITHSALVNHGGGLRKEREFAYPNPVHWISHLYGNLPIATAVRSVTESPSFAADIKGVASGDDFPLLDVVALREVDGNRLILLVINRHPTAAIEAEIALTAFSPAPRASVQTVAGDSYMATNRRQTPDAVRLEKSEITVEGVSFRFSFRPHSVTAIEIAGTDGV